MKWGFSKYSDGFDPSPTVRKNERFLVTEDFPVGALVHWKAPCTSGFKCTVPKGTILIADLNSALHSTAFIALPENLAEFEQLFVPPEDRNAAKYNGFTLIVPYSEIGVRIQRIETNKRPT